mmetsp:Transcript_48779/g.73698  ORF Transcript_48779/g.73698 Transcript_48779/m.73698 type:complete len:653 (-) Transcript_48779:797-2755(-)
MKYCSDDSKVREEGSNEDKERRIIRRKRRKVNAIKYQVRAGVKTVAFLGLLCYYGVPYLMKDNEGSVARALEVLEVISREGTDVTNDCGDKADPVGFVAFYLIGVLYMFVAIAVVCDELFVPALEEIASPHHMNLSLDVAGATLMAAGGSAPELFTNIFGTFVTEDEVGIGTVVGSAVFNVLFVIAMCALLSHETLQLTGWPLARDSIYYAFGLITLGLFVGVISPGEIELWEAIILFVEYLGYVVLMYFNETLQKKFAIKRETATDQALDDDEETAPGALTPSPRGTVNGQVWPGTFRSGVLKLLRDPEHHTLLESAGVGIVAQMAGDVDKVFKMVDVDGNGEIDKEELKILFSKLDISLQDDALDKVFDDLDQDNDGEIKKADFKAWYIQSEERIRSRVKRVFDSIDRNQSGTISREDIRVLLEKVEPTVSDDDVDEAMKVMCSSEEEQSLSSTEVTFEQFSEWYVHSMLYHRQEHKIIDEEEVEEEDDDENICASLSPPPCQDGIFAWIKYIILLPIVLVLALTVPDVRRPGLARWCYISFIVSILWIGVFSYFMVSWAEVIGNTIGIPPVVMGLTLLAAGTSVPDLLSSVIVARMGEGDMALSSSIGSNIFDIMVGLPVPWIVFTAIPSKPSTVVVRVILRGGKELLF